MYKSTNVHTRRNDGIPWGAAESTEAYKFSDGDFAMCPPFRGKFSFSWFTKQPGSAIVHSGLRDQPTIKSDNQERIRA